MNGYNKWNKTVTNIRKGKFDNLDVGNGAITVSFVNASTIDVVYLNVSQSTTGINASYINASFTNLNVSNGSIISLSSSNINSSNINSSYIVCTNIKSTSACFTSASFINNLYFTTGRYAAQDQPVLSVSHTSIRGWDWFNILQGCNNAYNVIVSPYNEITSVDNTLQIIGSKDRYLSTNYNGSFSYFNAVVSRPPLYVFPQSGPGKMYVTDGDMGTSSLELRSDSDVQRIVYTDCLTFAPNDAGGNDNYQVKISSSGLNVSSNAYLKSASATNASVTYLSGLSCSYTNASLYNTTMENASITSASISNASFSNITTSNASITSASISNASISTLTGTSCSYTNASLSSVTISNVSITSASISNASITWISGSTLNYLNVSSGNASSNNITSGTCSFTNASISNASITWISGSTLNFLNVSSGSASYNYLTSDTCSFINASISNASIATLTGSLFVCKSVSSGSAIHNNASITWLSGSTLNYLNVSSGNASSNNITSGTCSFTNASISNASITWLSGSTLNYLNVSSGNASSNSITSGTCSFTNASISNASITWISGSTLNYLNVSAGSASFNNLTSGTCSFTTASMTNASITRITGTTANYTNMSTTSISITNCSITNLTISNNNIPFLSTSNVSAVNTTGIINVSGRVVINASNNASQLLITCPSNVSQVCGIQLTNPSSGVNASGTGLYIYTSGATVLVNWDNKPFTLWTYGSERLQTSTNVKINNASLVLSTTPATGVSNDGALCIPSTQVINFGYDQTKEANAGKIGYGTMDSTALCIVGVGTATPRKVKIWDNLIINTSLITPCIDGPGSASNLYIGANDTHKGLILNANTSATMSLQYGSALTATFTNTNFTFYRTLQCRQIDTNGSYLTTTGGDIYTQGGQAYVTCTSSAGGIYTCGYNSGVSYGLLQYLSSSKKYKTNIRNHPNNALDRVLKLKPVVFNSLGEHDDKERDFVGFTAEEIDEVIPEGHYTVYHKDTKEPDAIDYSRMVVLLVKSIQELHERIEILESKLK